MGEEVEGGGDFGTLGTFRYLVGPPRDAGYPLPTLPGLALSATQGQVAPLLLGTVVGGEDDQGLLVQAGILERFQDFSRRPVDFLDGVTITTSLGFTFESGTGEKGNVREGVRQIDEEWLILVAVDELDDFLSVAWGDHRLVDGGLDDPFVSHEGQGHFLAVHVVRVRNAEVGIEALLVRKEIRVIADMPFSHADGGVVLGLEDFGNGGFIGVQSLSIRWKQHAQVSVVHMHVHASWVASGQQTGARRRAHSAGRVEAR